MMDTNFSSVIESAASVLILLPQKPTFDGVAAGVSLYMALLGDDKANRQVTIACPSPMMVGFNRIIGINKVTSELGNKNLTIKFKGYDANNIEKVSYDIVNGEFNLTVIPKTGFISPSEDQMDVSFSGVSADLIILAGGVSDEDYPALATDIIGEAKIVHIGNRSYTSAREVLSLAKPGSTLSELVAGILKDNSYAVDPDTATNLVMGIEEGSSHFAGSDVTPDTFEMFAWLLRTGGQRQSRIKLSPMGFPPGSIPTQPLNVPVQRPIAQPMAQVVGQMPQETDAMDIEGTGETEQEINPPDDWLQPKVFKGSAQPNQPVTFSENKG